MHYFVKKLFILYNKSMQLFTWNDIMTSYETGAVNPLFNNGTGISVGSFDGLHLGHRDLISKLVNKCAKDSLVPGVISFSRPLPSIKHSVEYKGDISTLNQRLEIFDKLGIKFAIIIDFDEDFAKTTGTEFLNILLNSCNMRLMAEGIDFKFGYKGATDVSSIRYYAEKHNLSTIFLDQIFYKKGTSEEERISSSYIRQMISKGFFGTVEELLNRPYAIDLSSLNLSAFTDKNVIKIPKAEITQVLPLDGTYSAKMYKNSLCEQFHLEITKDLIIFPLSIIDYQLNNIEFFSHIH